MSIPDSIIPLAGEWQGTNQLWLPDEPVRVSDTTMIIETAAQGLFALLRYTWADEGRPQDGLFVLGQHPNTTAVKATWIDSWHMGHGAMVLSGATGDSGKVTLSGSYAAPPGPEWGWRVEIVPQSASAFRFLMFNLTPDGEEFPAVAAGYVRRSNG